MLINQFEGMLPFFIPENVEKLLGFLIAFWGIGRAHSDKMV